MMLACLQTQDCSEILANMLFLLERTLSVCMEILPTFNGSPTLVILVASFFTPFLLLRKNIFS